MTDGGRRLGIVLAAPAVGVMLAVTAYPVAHAAWLSLRRYDLRFPGEGGFAGLANYADVLSSPLWWRDLGNTVLLTVASVALELVLGMLLALLMHRTLVARRLVRTATLLPYTVITVVAALAWRFAFDPVTGFVDPLLSPLLGREVPWLSRPVPSFAAVVVAEVWKTTPFMALLLLAGLVQVPEELLRAARVDGAGPWQRFVRVTLPLIRPAILVALLFRTLDAFRIFDSAFVMTRGSAATETVSILGYRQLLVRLNLGIGSAVSVLIFLCTVAIAWVFIRWLGAAPGGDGTEEAG